MQIFKLGVTCLLTMLILLPAFMQPASAATFTDNVPSWAIDSVDYLVEKEVMTGIGNNEFAPSKPLTRGEAAKIIALVLELDVNMSEKTDFLDAQEHWASSYIKAIQEEKPGVIDGFPDGTFQPNQLVTREELSKMIVLAYDFEKNTAFSREFDDVSGWAADYIDILASHFIVDGKSNRMFAPKDPVLRSEAAVMFHKASEIFPGTVNPEYDVIRTIERDGIEFEVELGQAYGKLYVKAKATNIGEDAVPYIASDGCDGGFAAYLFAADTVGDIHVQVGSKWVNPVLACNLAVWELSLEPGETAEELEIINLPTEGLEKNHYVEVRFQRGMLQDASTPPMILKIPVEIE